MPTKSGNVNRDEEKRKINETTCEQAEVLVKGEIAKPYIIKIEALDRY